MLEVDQPEPAASLAPQPAKPPNPLPSDIRWSNTRKTHIHIRSGRPIYYSGGHIWKYNDKTEGSVILPPTPASPLTSTSGQQNLSQLTLILIDEEIPSNLPPAPQYSTPPPPLPIPILMSSQTTILSEDKALNVRTLTPFTGKRERLANFIRECNLCMWGNEKRFATEQIKVVFVLSYMKDGTTEHWRNMHVQEMMENKRGCTDSWNALAAQLEKDFHDSNLADNRLTEVEMLRQGTGSADEYTVKFNTLIEETNIKEDALRLRYYMKGINASLVYKVYGLIPVPDTLALWQEKAIMYDNQ